MLWAGKGEDSGSVKSGFKYGSAHLVTYSDNLSSYFRSLSTSLRVQTRDGYNYPVGRSQRWHYYSQYSLTVLCSFLIWETIFCTRSLKSRFISWSTSEDYVWMLGNVYFFYNLLLLFRDLNPFDIKQRLSFKPLYWSFPAAVRQPLLHYSDRAA